MTPRDDDRGEGFRLFVRLVFRASRPVPDLTPAALLALPERVDSDTVRVTLADDATWRHMRGLYPSPEALEGC